MEEKRILELRHQIDLLDGRIVKLLGERATCAVEIGHLKQSKSMPAFDGCRERALMNAISAQNEGPLTDSALRRIFTEIVSACRAAQSPVKVSFLGPEATFTHQAAQEYFGGSCSFIPADSVTHVFRHVESGHADFGVVPVENSTEGSVALTLDRLAVSELKIRGEIFVRISHALMSVEEELGRIEQVLSHPQALAQCLGWLSANLPGRAMVEMSSTAAAAERAAEEPGAAAVGSEMSARVHGLKVLAGDIQDRSPNLTRFLVVGGPESCRTGRDKTSLLFVASHRPGALRLALTPFAEQGINISRIESRPSKETPWEYIFFVDLEGHLSDEPVATAMEGLKACVNRLKILGSYPVGALMGERSVCREIGSSFRSDAESSGRSRSRARVRGL